MNECEDQINDLKLNLHLFLAFTLLHISRSSSKSYQFDAHGSTIFILRSYRSL